MPAIAVESRLGANRGLFNGLLEALSELVKCIYDQGGPAYKDLKVASGADWIRPCGSAMRILIYHYETDRDISFTVVAWP
jgi:hypothetical protein